MHPLLNKLPTTKPEDRVGQRSLQNGYNLVNVSLAISGMLIRPVKVPIVLMQSKALLNWQWARTGGPVTAEERAIYWTMQVAHIVYGLRYAQVGEYTVLSVMWLAPALSLTGYKLGA